MLADNYKKIEVTSPTQLKKLFVDSNPSRAAIDTETDGIFQMTLRPFLIIFGWKSNDPIQTPVVTIFEPTKQMMEMLIELTGTVKKVFMHNMKFDLHAICNEMGTPYPHNNVLDTQVIARLCLPAVPVKEGGPKLALKYLADIYLEKGSSDDQKIIKQYKTLIKRERAQELELAIAKAGFRTKPIRGLDTTFYNTVSLEAIDADPILQINEEVPEVVAQLWAEWTTKYPKTLGMRATERVTYKDIYNYSPESKRQMIKYAYNDVVLTLELADFLMPYLLAAKQGETLIREQKSAYALWESERVGLPYDREYIEVAKQQMRNYLIELRKQLGAATGFEATKFAQSATQIKQWLESKGLVTPSTNKDTLGKIIEREDVSEEIKSVLSIVLEIRAVTKKYSTDLLKFDYAGWNGRLYGTFQQCTSVTGRLSSNMQQFPKSGLTTNDGRVLFEPRKAIITAPQDGYPTIAYLDYSQVEVRLQAHYTYLATNKKGDQNLIRLFAPFNCYRTVYGIKQKWNPDIKEQTTQKFIENNVWHKCEDDTVWSYEDYHGLTAVAAFPNLKGKEDTEEFKKHRSLAKNVNFALQYGAGLNKIYSMFPDVPKETVERLYQGNKQAFTGLVAYGKMIRTDYYANNKGPARSVSNLYGRMYRVPRYTHKLLNYPVQGSGADMLKDRLIACHEFLKGYKSRLMHNIHDELQFEIYEGEEHLIQKLKEIMEDISKFIIPIVADIEVTTTTWQDKKEVHSEIK